MSKIVGNLTGSIIEIVFITYIICILEKKRYKISDSLICVLLYIPNVLLIQKTDWRVYIIKNIYFLLIFVTFLKKNDMKIKRYMPIICMLLSGFETL